MNYVACVVPVAPLRKEFSHRSEMVSQLLFGECAELIEETTDFARIKSLYDDYEGWCQKSQLTVVDKTFAQVNHKLLTAETITNIEFNGQHMMLPPGCFIGSFDNGAMHIGQFKIVFSQPPFELPESGEDINMYDLVQPYMNTAYLWGGKSVYGIDCSGLVQQVFKMMDIKLPRDAYQQAEIGESVNFLQEVQAGDLAYFDNEEGRITHVGILLNNEHIVHASGKVRVDKIDHAGIINVDTGERTHKLRIIKRIK